MLIRLPATMEDQFMQTSQAAVHMNAANMRRPVPRSHSSAHPADVLPLVDKRLPGEDELVPCGTVHVHGIDDEENEAAVEVDSRSSPAPSLNDPSQMYLHAIGSIPMTPQQAEMELRKVLKISEMHIAQAALNTPLAMREIISLVCKLEKGALSIREVTADVSDKTDEKELVSSKTRVSNLVRRVKRTQHKRQLLRKQNDCGQLNEIGKDVIERMMECRTKQQIALLNQINPSRTIIASIVVKLKQYYRDLQKMHEGGLVEGEEVKRIEEDAMFSYTALKKTIATIEEAEKKIRQARNMLVTSHLGLVLCLAKRYKNRGLDFVDLVQEGNIGLIKAAHKFDAHNQYPFKAEAIWYIKNAMIRAIIKQGKTIRIPDYICVIMNKLARVSSRLVRETGREPTAEEMGQIIGIAPDKCCRHSVIHEFVSLESPKGREGKSCLKDLIEDNDGMVPGDDIDRRSMHESVKEMMERLNGQEKTVVSMRYGIGYTTENTLEQIGKSLSLTRQRVKQIEDKALAKLMKYSKRKGLGAFLEA